ncbi:hypothetical protein SPI_01407 [Niveomyces insectorum RCEF 264]|uniref:Uncharacterized protein n=1 Tax=Niveomyces insectorum RCEF 264 TaxID=1081102 RepID=A0A167YXY7_9HYPO|nr:hypothetical protein SPI_01407 [Niveomyces insectorum RCEF 264]
MARQRAAVAAALPLLLPLLLFTTGAAAAPDINLPSYHYGDPIKVECMNRSSETGEHIQLANHEIQWIPFPVCNETQKPLEFHYGIEGELACTLASVSDPFFHLLEFYLHADAPLACRLATRPAPHIETVGERPYEPTYVPLVVALAGALQLSHLHVATHLNVLLHSTPKHHIHPHDSGVLDSAVAYSTSPLGPPLGLGPGPEHETSGGHDKARNLGHGPQRGGQATTDRTTSTTTAVEPAAPRDLHRLVIGDPLPLTFSVRWFPTPALPKTEGRVEWSGMGHHVGPSTVFYSLVSFLAGLIVSAVYFFGTVLPRRLKGRSLGGATPLGYGVGNGVGNGWGIAPKRALD